jgi:hypothetical protein
MSRPKLPDEARRVAVFGRVAPSTKDFLKAVQEPNEGRALDSLVSCVKTVQEVFEEARRHSLPIPDDRIPGRVPLSRPEME